MTDKTDLISMNVATTSREIAELCGKRHDNVLQIIDRLLENVKDLSAHFRADVYTDRVGRKHRQFECTKKGAFMVVAGYTPAVRWRAICWLEEMADTLLEKLQDRVKYLEDHARYATLKEMYDACKGRHWFDSERLCDYCADHALTVKKVAIADGYRNAYPEAAWQAVYHLSID